MRKRIEELIKGYLARIGRYKLLIVTDFSYFSSVELVTKSVSSVTREFESVDSNFITLG